MLWMGHVISNKIHTGANDTRWETDITPLNIAIVSWPILAICTHRTRYTQREFHLASMDSHTHQVKAGNGGF